MARRLGLVLLLGLVASAQAGAQEAVTIKLKKAGKGDAVLIEQRMTEESTMQLLDANDKEVKKHAEKKIKLFVYRETVHESPPDAKRPTRLERAYEKAEVKLGVNTDTLPLEGKTVVIEKGKDGKYTFREKNGDELKGDGAKVLDDQFNKESDEFDIRKFLSPKPVKVGDTWDIDPTPLIKDHSNLLLFDGEKAKATGKLLSVRKDTDGRTLGKMEFKVVLPLKVFLTSQEKVPAEEGSKMTWTLLLDACIDGSAESGVLKVTIELSATAKLLGGKGEPLKMNLNSHVHAHERRIDPPPAKR